MNGDPTQSVGGSAEGTNAQTSPGLDQQTQQTQPKKKWSRKKKIIVWGVVAIGVVVLIIAGVVFGLSLFRAGTFSCPVGMIPGHWVKYYDTNKVVVDDCIWPEPCPAGTVRSDMCGPLRDFESCSSECLTVGTDGSVNYPALKPVIYLYPTHTQDVTVRLHYQGTLAATYPAYDSTISGWDVTASPDGTLTNHADGKQYSYIFWEGNPAHANYNLSTGFVVKGSDTAAFLQTALAHMGLTPREYNEFIVYWYPKMKDNPYNLIHFAGKSYTDIAPLTITPTPDSLLRVFMVYHPLQEPIVVQPQTIAPFQRHGFTVVEWGGTEVQ